MLNKRNHVTQSLTWKV